MEPRRRRRGQHYLHPGAIRQRQGPHPMTLHVRDEVVVNPRGLSPAPGWPTRGKHSSDGGPPGGGAHHRGALPDGRASSTSHYGAWSAYGHIVESDLHIIVAGGCGSECHRKSAWPAASHRGSASGSAPEELDVRWSGPISPAGLSPAFMVNALFTNLEENRSNRTQYPAERDVLRSFAHEHRLLPRVC
jgi:hypothetical protein